MPHLSTCAGAAFSEFRATAYRRVAPRERISRWNGQCCAGWLPGPGLCRRCGSHVRRKPDKVPRMNVLKVAFLVVGVLAILIGVIWVGQGSGYFPYPASSFMINQTPWIYRGAVVAALGLVVVLVSRRI
jgi:hypothetical protein